jgi:plasmid stabilization system protein ParE
MAQALFIAADKPAAAEKWLTALHEQIEALESMPRRHPIAHDLSESLGFEVHRLIVGEYLLFFRVDDTAELVDVLRFRHAAQRPLPERE